jgi:hypothetical protein
MYAGSTAEEARFHNRTDWDCVHGMVLAASMDIPWQMLIQQSDS